MNTSQVVWIESNNTYLLWYVIAVYISWTNSGPEDFPKITYCKKNRKSELEHLFVIILSKF